LLLERSDFYETKWDFGRAWKVIYFTFSFPNMVFSIIGIALFLVGVNEISKATGESGIFNYFLIAVILNVILVFFYLQIIITIGF